MKTINKNICADASSENLTIANAYGVYANEKSKILPMFDRAEGLTIRAERSKAHIRSVYNAQSSELKALTGKTY